MKSWQLAQARAEQHPFDPAPDSDFLCVCGKPRAVHLHDGHVPNPAPPSVCMIQSVRYGRTQPRNKVMFGQNCYEKQRLLDGKNFPRSGTNEPGRPLPDNRGPRTRHIPENKGLPGKSAP